MRGQKIYEDFCRSQSAKPSPVSVLALQDIPEDDTHVLNDDAVAIAIADSDKQAYLICLNKGDPLGLRPLLHPTQVYLDEIIRFDICWGDPPTTNILFYAYPDCLRTSLHGGYSCADFAAAKQAELFALGNVAVSKPLDCKGSNVLYVKICVSIWARTVTTTAFIPKDDEGYTNHRDNVPKPAQCSAYVTMVSCLDTFRIKPVEGA
jgi:hypothetical protein